MPDTNQPITYKDYLRLLLGTLIWGTAYVMVRNIAGHMEPMALALCRIFATVLFFAPMALVIRTPLKEVWAAKWYILLMSLLGSSVFMAIMSYGLYHSSATNGALINAAYPLASVLVARLVLKIKIKRHAIIPLIMAIVGSLILVISKPDFQQIGFSLGDMAFVINIFIWSFFSLLFIPFNNRLPAPTWGFWMNLLGCIWLIPVVVWEGFDFTTLEPLTIIKLLYVGMICGGIGTVLWGQSVSRLGMATAGLFNNINPLCAVALAAIFLGETMNVGQLMGGAILMSAVLIYSLVDYRYHTTAAPGIINPIKEKSPS